MWETQRVAPIAFPWLVGNIWIHIFIYLFTYIYIYIKYYIYILKYNIYAYIIYNCGGWCKIVHLQTAMRRS